MERKTRASAVTEDLVGRQMNVEAVNINAGWLARRESVLKRKGGAIILTPPTETTVARGGELLSMRQ